MAIGGEGLSRQDLPLTGETDIKYGNFQVAPNNETYIVLSSF